jgi:hypothetical protein
MSLTKLSPGREYFGYSRHHVTLTAFSQFGKHVNKGHSFGHILTRNQAVSRCSIWFVPQVTVAEFNIQGGCDKSGIFKILF